MAWLPPREPFTDPAEDEYSRLLEPGKYRILGRRVNAWTAALADLGPASWADGPAGELAWRERPAWEVPMGRAVVVRPGNPDSLALVFVGTTIDDVIDCGLILGVGTPTVPATLIPRTVVAKHAITAPRSCSRSWTTSSSASWTAASSMWSQAIGP